MHRKLPVDDRTILGGDPPYDREAVMLALASKHVCDRTLDASLAMMLGHEVTIGQANFTMEPTYAIRWASPHPYGGMTEPCPAFSDSLDASIGVVRAQFRDWTLTRLGQDGDGWTAVLKATDDGREVSASVPLGVPAARCVVMALLQALDGDARSKSPSR